MTTAAVLHFVTDFVKSWDKRRGRCFARLVYGLMRGGRLGVSEIARFIPSPTSDKHHIKAVDRFLGNNKVDLLLLWKAIICLAARKKARLYVMLDWSDVGHGFEVLKAAVRYGGRALPIAWSTTRKGYYGRSRNVFESNLCKVVKTLLPSGVQMVVVADRGYCRASFFRALRRANIDFVIRIRRDVHLIQGRGWGPVHQRVIRRGNTRDLTEARYGEVARVPVRCILTWGRSGRGEWAKGPWYLVTSLRAERFPAQHIVDVYKSRMRIEESFRDHKSMRFGFQLRSVRLTSVDRYDRLFAIAAVALLLLVNIGAYAEAKGLDRGYRANTVKERTHSLFHLGQGFLLRLGLRVPRIRLLLIAFDSPG